MAVTQTKPTGVHLVGSLHFASTEEALRTTAEILGDRLRRLPDGETGPRAAWVGWQSNALTQVPTLEVVEAPDVRTRILFKPRDGVAPRSVDLGTMGYPEMAAESYGLFKRLRSEGLIPRGVRFQVSMPTPFAGTRVWLVPGAREPLTPAFTRAMCRAAEEITSSIPAQDLAIQWDVCLELGLWERPYYNFDKSEPLSEEAQQRELRRLGELGAGVPQGVEVGYHLCYGDWDHAHFKQPEDSAVLVQIANGIFRETKRQVSWIHMPVPRSRDDEAYFAPLRDLRLPPGCELYLGLVHYTDGVVGTARRVATARRFVSDFGVATECGMGRRPEGHDMRQLLQVHHDVSAPVR